MCSGSRRALHNTHNFTMRFVPDGLAEYSEFIGPFALDSCFGQVRGIQPSLRAASPDWFCKPAGDLLWNPSQRAEGPGGWDRGPGLSPLGRA